VNPDPAQTEGRFSVKGKTGLIVAGLVVLILLVGLPPYRWFFLISVGIGLVVAGVLYLWHKYRPLKEEDVEKKKPLGLE
jgi:uncharacterized membrane protein YqjE